MGEGWSSRAKFRWLADVMAVQTRPVVSRPSLSPINAIDCVAGDDICSCLQYSRSSRFGNFVLEKKQGLAASRNGVVMLNTITSSWI